MDEKTQTETSGETTQESPKTKREELQEREELVAKEEELLGREREIKARQELEGESEAGQTQTPQISEEEKASRERIKEIGKATGAKWADDMDKQDGT